MPTISISQINQITDRSYEFRGISVGQTIELVQSFKSEGEITCYKAIKKRFSKNLFADEICDNKARTVAATSPINENLIVRFIDGKAVYASILFRSSEHSLVYKKLVEKYGDPNKIENSPIQKRFGSDVTYRVFYWSNSVSIMSLNKPSFNSETTEIEIRTPDYYDIVKLRQSRKYNSVPYEP